MDLASIFLLGLIQGLTEFLPISSSGHLVLVKSLLGLDDNGILIEVILHLGTLLSIITFYHREVFDLSRSIINRERNGLKYLRLLFVATIPSVIIGLLFKDEIESLFSPLIVPYMLIITGLVLLGTRYIGILQKPISLKIAILVGIAQVLAIIPGISRSGITISIALFLGLNRGESAKFSFFLAMPILLGAGILQLGNIIGTTIDIWVLALGFLSAFISGYFVIGLLIKIISKKYFWVFGYYCIFIGTISFFLVIG